MQLRIILGKEPQTKYRIGAGLYLVEEQQCFAGLHLLADQIGYLRCNHMCIQIAIKERMERLLLIEVNLHKTLELLSQMPDSG